MGCMKLCESFHITPEPGKALVPIFPHCSGLPRVREVSRKKKFSPSQGKVREFRHDIIFRSYHMIRTVTQGLPIITVKLLPYKNPRCVGDSPLITDKSCFFTD